MYVILVYDVNVKRVAKMLKLCRKYMHWVQNSVFEGEMTESQLEQLLFEARKLINPATDSIIVFKNRNEKWLDKQIIGLEKSNLDNVL